VLAVEPRHSDELVQDAVPLRALGLPCDDLDRVGADLRAGLQRQRGARLDPAGREAGAARDAALADGQSAAMIRVLGHAVLREDADFHAYQTLEAGVRQFNGLHERHPLAARRTLVAVSRFVAAHAPTSRSLQQTYQIAVRLLRGDDLTVAAED